MSLFIWIAFVGDGFLVSSLMGGVFHFNDWGLSGWIFYALALLPTRVAWRRLSANAHTPRRMILTAITLSALLAILAGAFAWLFSLQSRQ